MRTLWSEFDKAIREDVGLLIEIADAGRRMREKVDAKAARRADVARGVPADVMSDIQRLHEEGMSAARIVALVPVGHGRVYEIVKWLREASEPVRGPQEVAR